MKYPRKKLKNSGRISLNQTFPYCVKNHFNMEPANIRNSLGTYGFKDAMKFWTGKKCRHDVKSLRMKFCNECTPSNPKNAAIIKGIEGKTMKNKESEKKLKMRHMLIFSMLKNKHFLKSKDQLKNFLIIETEKAKRDYVRNEKIDRGAIESTQ